MISASVAVEGQGRSLGQVLGQPPPVAEFLRPLPRAAPYARYPQPPHVSQLSQPSQLAQLTQQRLREEEESPSAASGYPVPGPYHRFLPNHFPYYPSYPAPAPPVPAPPPPPVRSPPRGKEGSLKHRLLSRERPPPSARFSRGALIQLGDGELRRVEDMRTEDFVQSAERSPELRLADSTVVRLLRRPNADSVTLTLSYNENRSQVDMEYPVEHPFFVYGHGWSSCSPERTMQCFGLRVNRLKVHDVCVSLIRREKPLQLPSPVPPAPPVHLPPPPPPPPVPHGYGHHQPASATIVTTATTTAMTVRPADAPQSYPENLSLREDSRKRRWSAPDICDDDGAPQRPRIMRH